MEDLHMTTYNVFNSYTYYIYYGYRLQRSRMYAVMRPMAHGRVLQHVAECLAGIVSVESDPFRSELQQKQNTKRGVYLY